MAASVQNAATLLVPNATGTSHSFSLVLGAGAKRKVVLIASSELGVEISAADYNGTSLAFYAETIHSVDAQVLIRAWGCDVPDALDAGSYTLSYTTTSTAGHRSYAWQTEGCATGSPEASGAGSQTTASATVTSSSGMTVSSGSLTLVAAFNSSPSSTWDSYAGGVAERNEYDDASYTPAYADGVQASAGTITPSATASSTSTNKVLLAISIAEAAPAGPAITDVNTDEALSPGETATITGTGFGATQGAGGVKLTQEAGALESALTIIDWSDTEITATVNLGGLSFNATTSLVVTDNAAATGSIAVTFPPATGYAAVTLSGYPGTGYVVGEDASPAVVDGDQVEYESTASSGATVTVNADGTFVLSTTDPASFSYRVRDNTDNTWSSWGTIRVNMPNQGGAGINLGIRIGV